MSSGRPWQGRRLHFIGVGGAGMSGLALVARALGAEVSGSDRVASSYTERLRATGIHPAIGHDASNLPDGAEVVVSTAIPRDNPELAKARDAGLRILHRGDLLSEEMALKRSVAVAGAHGKTTTSAMLAHVLRETGRDPAFVIGGELRAARTNAAWGEGEWIVVEADESDRSFLKLSPDVAVVTNIELDHHTTYGSEAELIAAFAEFAAKAGERIVWERAPLDVDALRFGIGEGEFAAADVELAPGGSRFDIAVPRVEERHPVTLAVPGRHNVLNALAALAAAERAGVPFEESAPAIASFSGTGRRFEARGTTSSGALVFDDYAHHPTEVRATLEAARTLDGERLVAVFQPHLYSRTQHLAKQFGEALALADAVVVVGIYPARERAEDFPGVSGHQVAAAAARAGRGRPVYWLPSMDDAAAMLERDLHEGDVLLTLGAGNIDSLAGRLAS
ncbi:MAG: UDP-N-acetylmuramate--L-alanine ligase [Thermoleophilaceae bacterium]